MTRDELEASIRQELTAIWNNALLMAAAGEGMGFTARSNLATAIILDAAELYASTRNVELHAALAATDTPEHQAQRRQALAEAIGAT